MGMRPVLAKTHVNATPLLAARLSLSIRRLSVCVDSSDSLHLIIVLLRACVACVVHVELHANENEIASHTEIIDLPFDMCMCARV